MGEDMGGGGLEKDFASGAPWGRGSCGGGCREGAALGLGRQRGELTRSSGVVRWEKPRTEKPGEDERPAPAG